MFVLPVFYFELCDSIFALLSVHMDTEVDLANALHFISVQE